MSPIAGHKTCDLAEHGMMAEGPIAANVQALSSSLPGDEALYLRSSPSQFMSFWILHHSYCHACGDGRPVSPATIPS